MNRRTLFFQEASIGSALLAMNSLRHADSVLLFRPYSLESEALSATMRWRFERFVRSVNPSIVVSEQEPERVNRLWYINNMESDQHVERAFETLRRLSSYRIVRRLIPDSAVDFFYKMRLLERVLFETQYYRSAADLYAREAGLILIPSRPPTESLWSPFFSSADLARRIPRPVRLGLRAGDLLNGLAGFLLNPPLLGLAPFLGILKRLFRFGIRSRSRQPIRVDVVRPLIWGLTEGGVYRGMKTGMDNSDILGGPLEPSRIAFYFSHWIFSPEERRQQLARMEERGIRCVDPQRLPIPLSCAGEVARFAFRLWGEVLRNPSVSFEKSISVRLSASLLNQYLQELLFNRSIEYKVLIEEQDYSAAHVVRTLVANQLGRRTIGMHHGAPDGPGGFPILRYTHINHHCIWGEGFRRAYGSHWDRLRSHATGAYRVDWIRQAQRPDRLRVLQAQFERTYGGVRPLVVILFPSLERYILRSQIEEKIQGLALLRELPDPWTVICRFRSPEIAEQYRKIGLQEVLSRDPRIHVDLTEMTTYEWFALSDAVIASGTSTALIEACAAGKPTFTFDDRLLAERVFSSYGRDIVLKNRCDLRRVFEGLRTEFRGFDCDWKRLGEDYSAFSDGRSLDRYRNIILQAVRDAGGGLPVSELGQPLRAGSLAEAQR